MVFQHGQCSIMADGEGWSMCGHVVWPEDTADRWNNFPNDSSGLWALIGVGERSDSSFLMGHNVPGFIPGVCLIGASSDARRGLTEVARCAIVVDGHCIVGSGEENYGEFAVDLV